jgi:hypothetical protein
VIDERARHELHRTAAQLLGTERADTLMSLLPPVGRADVATEDDIHQLEARLDARFAHLEARTDARFAIVDARFENVDARFVRLDTRLAQLEGHLDHRLRDQTRTLMVGVVGAMCTLASLCLGAVALTP